jgi:two-component sensor histidine kinase
MLGMSGQPMPSDAAFLEQFVHPEDHARIHANAQAHLAGVLPHDVEYRLKTPRGYRWVRSRGLLARGPDGRPLRFAGSIVDVHDRREIEHQLRSALAEQERLLQREHTLLRELNHRVRNNLAGILGLVNLYQRTGRTAADFGEAIRDKVFALRQVHDLMSLTAGSAIELSKLVAALADAMVPVDRRSHLEFVGPHVAVSPSQSSAIAMIFQELITNSVKHGALRRGTGRTRCSWDIVATHHDTSAAEPSASDERLTLQIYWHETGLAGLTAPQHRGIGIGLIEGLARSDLGGSAEFDFAPGGILCAIQVELTGCDQPVTHWQRPSDGDMDDSERFAEPRSAHNGTLHAGPRPAEPAQPEEMHR